MYGEMQQKKVDYSKYIVQVKHMNEWMIEYIWYLHRWFDRVFNILMRALFIKYKIYLSNDLS